MADKRISQLIERVDIANNDVLPIVASGATTTNKVTISTIQDWMQDNLDVGVTSVGITIGTSGNDVNVTGSPITTSGNITINIPTATATIRGLLSPSDFSTFNNKLSSVGLSMPSAFVVSNSPLTANGTIAVTGAGTVSQYIRGDGSLADFPEAGSGGSSVSYYLNGSVSQGTIGGIAYREMNKTPILGAGTDFVAIADGYLASFITDAGDPSLLLIPGGNWNFESYFSASSGGGTPSFYIELYKVDSGGTATLIASNSAVPELIAFGTTITPYFSTLAVPTTTLDLTDRLALRYYVARSGRTITLHTENSHLCQIITTFTTGLTALNGLTAQVQNFATGTSGTDFNISSTSATHTFNLPDASASARGLVTTGSQTIAGIKTFSSNMNADGGVRLPASGTALPTFVNNISGSGLSSSGSNGFGFNNANNFYFSGSDKGGSVFVVNNTATRNYTFQDTSGVIALTSNIPTNPVGGSGTINQIPKYTSSTTTIGNSNISDNGSDVVISSRTGISLSGQSILFTPNLGGTTNRIETTGGLPLTLVTSGSSITLAAGGTTPQITLASTGAVTLTGALNGTSASFSSTLQAGGEITTGSVSRAFLRQTAGGDTELGCKTGGSTTIFSNGTSALSIATTGAATFSSSVTGTSFSLGTGNGRLSTSGFWGTQITAGTGSFSNFALLDAATNGIMYNPAGTLNMTFTGNVGIGVSPHSWDAGWLGGNTNNLEVGQSGSSISAGVGGMLVMNNVVVNGGAAKYARSFPATYYIQNTSSGQHQWFTAPSGTAGNAITFTQAMTLTNTGNLGIGTTSPSGLWSGDNRNLNILSPANNSSELVLSRTAGSVSAASVSNFLSGTTADFGIYTTAALNYVVYTNNTERMRITSGGYTKSSNSGNYDSPNGTYHEVHQNSTNYISVFTNTNTASGGVNGILVQTAGTANTSNLIFDSYVSGAYRFRVFSNGNAVNTNGSYGSISDAKLKENIEDASPKLNDLMKVKVRNYNLIGDDKKQIGVIAQELEEVFPAMIDESEDFEDVEVPQLDEEGNEILNEEGEVVTTKERVSKGTTTKSVKYSVFVPMLIKAMQEQQEQIKSLTEQVEALKSQING